jgi:hypothetical protein
MKENLYQITEHELNNIIRDDKPANVQLMMMMHYISFKNNDYYHNNGTIFPGYPKY